MSGTYKGKYMKPIKQPTFKTKLKRFKQAVRKNKFYRWALCGLVCFTAFEIGRLDQYFADKAKYSAIIETRIEEITQVYEAELSQMSFAHNEEITAIRAEYELVTPEKQLQQEAEYIARVLYGTALEHDARDQRTLVWCILNRVDSSSYPNTVKEVCQQPSQWIGYDDNNPILTNLYELAIEELTTWHNNYRPVSEDYVYMSWSSKEIKLRDTYEKKDNTRYWQAG